MTERDDRYRAITETSIDAIITSDTTDTILTWNRGAEHIFGYKAEEIIGKRVITIIPERYRKRHLNGIRRFIETGEKHLLGNKIELEALKKNGAEFPIELSLSTWEEDSGILFGAIIRDLSERKQLEKLKEDVNRMIRHDIKSPLIGIMGLAGRLLKDDNLTQRQKKIVSLIEDMGNKSLRFLKRHQDLFRMESGTFVLEPKPVDLKDMIKRIRRELQPLAARYQTSIKIDFVCKKNSVDRDFVVPGDEDLLEMMLANLIKNAVEASVGGEPVVVKIEDNEKDGIRAYILDIFNTGTIPREIRGNFFDPYTTSGKSEGVGLGTHNALLIARTHKGDIKFTTSKDEGTHLLVILPL